MMESKSQQSQKNWLEETLKREQEKCPECGCHGAHFCTGKPLPEGYKEYGNVS
jgi:hypothetical protein